MPRLACAGAEVLVVFSQELFSDSPRRRPFPLWLGAIALGFSLTITSGHAGAAPEKQAAPAIVAQDAPSRGASNVSPEVAQKAAAIARQTMSPFCPGRTLSDCPSEYATQWRKDIRAMVAQGMSAAEIQKELESRVGENLSGSPNRRAGYGVSIGLALGAALVLFFVLSKLRSNAEANSDKKGAKKTDDTKRLGSEVDDARLDEELKLADGEED